MSLVERQPIDTITITDVVKEASVSRPTFYQHFASIPDAVRQTTAARFSAAFPLMPATFEHALGGDAIREQSLRQTVPVLAHLKQSSDFYRRVFEEAADVAFIDRLIDFAASHFMAEAFDGAARRANVDRGEVVRFMASGISWIVIAWVRSGCAEDVETVGRRIASISVGLVQPRT